MSSAGLYRALLRLYPASFRNEYGGEMMADFVRRRREVRGGLGLVGLLAGAVVDVSLHAAAAHRDVLVQDARYAGRSLRRSPGFALTALLLVALGVGANTAAFSVADFVLLRPLPFPESDRLVRVWERVPGYSRMEASPADYRDWKRLATPFESMAAFNTVGINLTGRGDPRRIEVALVSSELLPTLGVAPMMGRSIASEDDRDGAAGTLLLSYRLWQSSFGGDAEVVGRTVRLDDHPYTVIGVMPPSFQFPSRDTEAWKPLQLPGDAYEDRNDNWLEVVGRLKPGVTLGEAGAAMDLVAAALRKEYPANDKVEISVIGLRDQLQRQSRLLLYALCGAALCVLLIACANLASLLLARGLARRQELAVRAAIGAGRERLLRQLATEGMLLALGGGVVGVLVALACLPLLSRLVPFALPVAGVPGIDGRVLAFALALTVATGLAFSLLPALRASGRAGLDGLREGARAGAAKETLRAALVVAEIVASMVLITSTGLLLRAMWRIEAQDPGFRPEGVLTVRTALPLPKYASPLVRGAFYDRVVSEVRRLPGVTSAAYITGLPMAMPGGIWPVAVAGAPIASRAEGHNASLRYVTPGYFASLGIPIHSGRDVQDGDTRERPFVAVVSESLVDRYWPGQDPIGRHFTFALHEREVVGVTANVRVRGLEQSSEPQIYLPAGQVEDNAITGYAPKDLVVRASTATTLLLPEIRNIVHGADPEQPLSDVRTMDEVLATETASRGVQLRVLAGFALIAAILGAVGIHGLLALVVSQRAREIGVRVALGAEPRTILGMVFGRGMRLGVLGVVPGMLVAYAVGRALEALLAGVKPWDPATFLSVVLLSLAMTLAGSLLPTLRALRLDPVQALRAD
jgi:predicted permease